MFTNTLKQIKYVLNIKNGLAPQLKTRADRLHLRIFIAFLLLCFFMAIGAGLNFIGWKIVNYFFSLACISIVAWAASKPETLIYITIFGFFAKEGESIPVGVKKAFSVWVDIVKKLMLYSSVYFLILGTFYLGYSKSSVFVGMLAVILIIIYDAVFDLKTFIFRKIILTFIIFVLVINVILFIPGHIYESTIGINPTTIFFQNNNRNELLNQIDQIKIDRAKKVEKKLLTNILKKVKNNRALTPEEAKYLKKSKGAKASEESVLKKGKKLIVNGISFITPAIGLGKDKFPKTVLIPNKANITQYSKKRWEVEFFTDKEIVVKKELKINEEFCFTGKIPPSFKLTDGNFFSPDLNEVFIVNTKMPLVLKGKKGNKTTILFG